MKKIISSLLVVSVLSAATANAAIFAKNGQVKRILVEDTLYSGCMVYLDSLIGNGCPSSWVSLDCNGLFNGQSAESGKQKLATATAAQLANKSVNLYIDNSNKVNGFCVARRIDLLN